MLHALSCDIVLSVSPVSLIVHSSCYCEQLMRSVHAQHKLKVSKEKTKLTR